MKNSRVFGSVMLALIAIVVFVVGISRTPTNMTLTIVGVLVMISAGILYNSRKKG